VAVEPAALLGVADGQLGHGVAAVVGVQLDRAAGLVGHEGVVVPGSKQLALVGAVAHAAHDQPVAARPGLGDLRDARVGIADVGPGALADRGGRSPDGLGLAHRDREAHVMSAQPGKHRGRPEPRVGPGR
jgi:hypothetical protein